jgi:glycosyltransferase involved in cell wall biosynthesis
MRILYSHRIQSRDGQSVHVDEIVNALRTLGHEVLIVGPGFYEKASFGGESRFISLIRSRLPLMLGELAELAYNIPAYWQLRRASRTFQPDLIYERYNLYYLAGTLLARRTGVKLFLEVNAPLAEERSQHGGLRLRRFAHWLERFVWRSADRVLAVTGVLKNTIATAGVPAERIAVVPNGIDPDRFIRLPSRPQHSDPVVLGFVGFVREWHGLDAVIAAMAAHADISLDLVVVGDGPVLPALRRQAEELGISHRVRFTGLQQHDAVPGLVAGFDIALQPRVVAYASPLKLFEYMAAGKAIVAPDQPNIREILTDGETGLLFDPRNAEAMWQAISRVAVDPVLRNRLGIAAQAEISRRDYTWRGNARRIIRWAGSVSDAA